MFQEGQSLAALKKTDRLLYRKIVRKSPVIGPRRQARVKVKVVATRVMGEAGDQAKMDKVPRVLRRLQIRNHTLHLRQRKHGRGRRILAI